MIRQIAFIVACCLIALKGSAQESPYTGVSPDNIIDGDYYLYNVETGLWLGDNHTNKDRFTSRAELGKRGIDIAVTHVDGGFRLNPKLGHNHSLNADNLYMDTDAGVTIWQLTATDNGTRNGVRITSGQYTLGADASGRIVNNASERNTWQLVTRHERMLTDTRNASVQNPADLSWAVYGGTFPIADERRSLWQGPWGSNSNTGDNLYHCNRVWEMWGIRGMEVFQELTDLPNGRYAVRAQALYSPTPNNEISEAHLKAYQEGRETTAGYVFAADKQVEMKNIYTLAGTKRTDNFNTKDLGNGTFMPDGIQQIANHIFEGQGLTEETTVSVDRGRLRFGVRVKEGTGKSWIIFDNFSLTYLGPDDTQTDKPEETATIKKVEYREGDKAHLCITFGGTADMAFEHGVAGRVAVTDATGRTVAYGVAATNCYDEQWHPTTVRVTLSNALPKGNYTVSIPANSLLLKELGYDVYRLPLSMTFNNETCIPGDGDNQEPAEELNVCQTYADGVRIAWQYNRQRYIGGGSYGRAIRLNNGQYVLVYSTGGSNIGGDNFIHWQNQPYGEWSEATILRPGDAYHTNKNTEIIELMDGRLMYAWLYRTNYDNSKGPSKIMAAYSTDGGKTWGDEQVIYTATDTYGLGVWEPAMLQLPSGELQIYFANEASAGGGSQNISMRRSFNGGRSWQPGTEIVSYRSGSRDGMPVPLYLKNRKGIAVAIEDPGFMGTFKPMVVHSDDNWASGQVGGNSTHRWSIFPSSNEYLPSAVYCGQPYLIQLNTGETVYSAASGEERNPNTVDTHGRMAVYVGDDNAKNFIARSFPFPFTNDLNARAIWNSIMQYNDSTLMAICTVEGEIEKTGIWTSEGKIMRPIPSLRSEGELNWKQVNKELFIGAESQAEARIASLWDENNVYFRFRVKDNYVTDESKEATDGVEVFLSATKPAATGRNGLYRFRTDIKGLCRKQHGIGTSWVTDSQTAMNAVVTPKTDGYEVMLTIPWTEIGGKPADDELYCCYQLHNTDYMESKTITVHETLSGSNINKGATWMRMPLEAGLSTGITAITPDNDTDTDSRCYNIMGQRVTDDAKGIIITGGKKIMKR